MERDIAKLRSQLDLARSSSIDSDAIAVQISTLRAAKTESDAKYKQSVSDLKVVCDQRFM